MTDFTLDDLLMQEIQSLKEQIKILVSILKYHIPDMDDVLLLHSLGHCDYQEYESGCNNND